MSETKLVELKFLGKRKFKKYSGIDPSTGQAIRCERGDIVKVSEEKAKQLKKDFPDQWGTAKDEVEEDPMEAAASEVSEEEVEEVEEPEEEESDEDEEEAEEAKPRKKKKKKGK